MLSATLPLWKDDDVFLYVISENVRLHDIWGGNSLQELYKYVQPKRV